MFGGLHIEMAALKTIGDWLQGSGWAQTLVQAEIATARTADSLYRAAHVMRTRRAHQITAAALYILQHCAYNHYIANGQSPAEFDVWCDQSLSESFSLIFTHTRSAILVDIDVIQVSFLKMRTFI